MRNGQLVATTLLAANCDEALTDLCGLLAARDLPLWFDPAQDHATRRRAVFAGEVDLVWLCGLLAVTTLADRRLTGSVRLAPVFAGRTAPVYQSVVVARRSSGFASLADTAGARLAINEYESWSGYRALVRHLTRRRRSIDMFAGPVVTGGHVDSVSAVQRGEADVAAIDDSVWAWLTEPARRDLVVIDRTAPAPSPPILLGPRIEAADAVTVAAVAASVGSDQVTGIDRFAATSIDAYTDMAGGDA